MTNQNIAMTNGSTATGSGGCFSFNKNYLYGIGFIIILAIVYFWGYKTKEDADKKTTEPETDSKTTPSKSSAAAKKSSASAKKSSVSAKKTSRSAK